MSASISTVRPKPDQVLVDIADYVSKYRIRSTVAFDTARYCLLDTLGCGLEALSYPACTKLMGPIVPGTIVPNGAKVPGTQFQLDPVQAAFNIGAMIRWLDFNDTWLAAEWGHPSDNLGGILAVADWLSRNAVAAGRPPLTMRDVLTAMIKAHEIQGVIALENSFNRVGLDHVVLVKVASTAVVAQMLGLSRDEIVNAISLAFVDGQSLRTYRHAPNTGSRKSWAAGDATARARTPRADREDRRDGLSVGADREDLGLLRRAVQGQAVRLPAPLWQLRDGERAVQDQLPRGVPFADGGGGGDDAPPRARAGRQIDRRHQADHDPHARGLHPDHRQEGAAREPGRSRSLHPVHGRGAAHLRAPDGRRLRGRRRGRPADRRAARAHRVRRGSAVHEGLPRSGQALDRERADGRVQGRPQAEGSRRRVSDRPQAAAQGWHPAAGREVSR